MQPRQRSWAFDQYPEIPHGKQWVLKVKVPAASPSAQLMDMAGAPTAVYKAIIGQFTASPDPTRSRCPPPGRPRSSWTWPECHSNDVETQECCDVMVWSAITVQVSVVPANGDNHVSLLPHAASISVVQFLMQPEPASERLCRLARR